MAVTVLNNDIVPGWRTEATPYHLQIGDCLFRVPPEGIQVREVSGVNILQGIRQRGSIKTKAGYGQTEIRVRLWFNDVDDINGLPVPAPDGRTYYLDGLRPLIAQFRRTPILPVFNEYLNDVHGIFMVVLGNIVVQTLENFPDALSAELILYKTTITPYMFVPDYQFADYVCWPVFRWYYQQLMADGRPDGLARVRTKNLTGEWGFRLLDEEALQAAADRQGIRATFTPGEYEIVRDEEGLERAIVRTRDFCQRLGLEKDWDAQTGEAIVAGRRFRPYRVDEPGISWIFVRQVGEALGYRVDYDQVSEVITVSREGAAEPGADLPTVPVTFPDDVKLTSLVIGFGNIFANLQVQMHTAPSHQFLGSLDTEIIATFETVSREGVRQFKELEQACREYTLAYHDRFVGGYVRFDNELAALFGVRFVLLNGVETETVEGFPDLFRVGVRMVEYNPVQQKTEQPEALKYVQGTFKDVESVKADDFTDVEHACLAEKMLEMIELYPDLELPSTAQVRGAVDLINAQRAAFGLPPLTYTVWCGRLLNPNLPVDPDFYMQYPYLDENGEIANPGIENEDLGIPTLREQWAQEYSPGMGDLRRAEANGARGRQPTFSPGVEQWRELAAAAARLHGVDPNCVLAIIEIESAGNPRAFNKDSGAYGLMQVVARFHPEVWNGGGPFDPANNISVGTAVYADCLGRFGDPVLAAAAYNCGPSWLERIIQQAGTTDVEALRSRLPRETRDYVDRFRRLLEGSLPTNVPETPLTDLAVGERPGWYRPAESTELYVPLPRQDMAQSRIDPAGLTPDQITNLMCRDMARYDRRGRFLQAFPAFLLLFVDEGRWAGGRKLWNNFYAYHSLLELSVVKDRNTPADIAYITLTNVYGALNYYTVAPVLANQSLLQKLFPTVTAETVEQRQRLLGYLDVQPGCRVHLRMGYGAVASALPVVLNGVIAEIDVDETITFVVQGDGHELTNEMANFGPDKQSGSFNVGKEPLTIIRRILAARGWGFHLDLDTLSRLVQKDDYAALSREDMEKAEYVFGASNPYGIEHFGVVRKEGDYLLDFWGDIKTYDVMKNVYTTAIKIGELNRHWYDAAVKGEGESAPPGILELLGGLPDRVKEALGNLTKEPNIGIWLGGKTPWDVFQTLAKCTDGYICGVLPHQFRSTFFFGLPWWPVSVGYMFKEDAPRLDSVPEREASPPAPEEVLPADNPPNPPQQGYLQKLFDFSRPKWMQPVGMGDLRKAEAQAPAGGGRRKTKDDFVEVFTSFQQFHVFDSYTSIIHNSVKASGRDIVTNAAAVYTMGRGAAALGPVMMADWTIRSELQKTDVVDSGTVQNIIGPDGLYAFFGYNPGEARAKTFAKSHIVSKMRDMYQDELIVLGTPALKPYDAFYLSDVYTGMYGLAEVGRVVHHLTADTGFVSTVKPDLCVRAKEAGELWNQPLLRLLTLGTYTTLQGAKLLVAKRVAGAAYLGARNASLLSKLPAMGKLAYEKLRAFVQTEGLGNKLAKIKSALAGVRARALLSPASFNPLVVAAEVLILGTIDKAIKGIADWFANRNTVVIYPLFFKDRPFVAGIAGAKNLIAWENSGQTLPPPTVQGVPGQQVLPGGMFLAWPAPSDGVVTGHFGERRTSPYPHTHSGLDIAFSPEDAPIWAAQKGRVSFAGSRGGYGNLVIIDHGGGVETYYAHLSAIKVATGQEVQPGNVIGSQGSTGQSTGPHLHFELRINGEPVNPLPYLPSPGGR